MCTGNQRVHPTRFSVGPAVLRCSEPGPCVSAERLYAILGTGSLHPFHSMETDPDCCVHFLLTATEQITFHGVDRPLGVSATHSLKDIRVLSRFGLLQTKPTNIHVHESVQKSSFLGLNAQECSCWVAGQPCVLTDTGEASAGWPLHAASPPAAKG